MKPIKNGLFWTLQIGLALVLLEVICYGFLKTSSNPLYRARRILQHNEDWGWQACPNLKTEFEGAPVWTESNGFRVESAGESVDLQKVELLTLGPSSAFGWGVAADNTYTAQIAKALHLNYLNAAQIGFSTEQGLLVWNLFLKSQLPNLKYVIISYGINDLDRFRFYDLSFVNDVSYFNQKGLRSKPFLGPVNSNLLTAFNLFENEALLKLDCSPLRTIKQRLSFSEYDHESRALIQALKEKNVKTIFVGTPYQRMPLNKDFQYGDVQEYYQAAESAATAGHCREALSLIGQAKVLEPWRVEQDVARLTDLQKQLSRDEDILYIDAYNAFHDLKTQKEYFVDPVHPTIQGHKLIADLILEKLK